MKMMIIVETIKKLFKFTSESPVVSINDVGLTPIKLILIIKTKLPFIVRRNITQNYGSVVANVNVVRVTM